MDKRYFNVGGIIVGVGSLLMILLLLDSSVYEDTVVNPADMKSNRSTSNLIMQTFFYFIDKKIGRWGIFSVFVFFSILGLWTGVNWREIFKKKDNT